MVKPQDVTSDITLDKVERKRETETAARQLERVPDDSLLAVFFRSTGLKWMVGMGQTICMGSASTRHEFFLSHPAPSRNRPWINTPSWMGRRGRISVVTIL